MAPSSPSWREIGWNGVRFEAPSNWEPSRVGSCYLLFEDGVGPVLEAKWGMVKGRFSHAAQLKRLSAGRGRKKGAEVTPADLPSSWAAALSQFEGSGFSWRGEGVEARGAILYCPTCRRAGLVQFFNPGRGVGHEDMLRVLASYRDHADSRLGVWSLFDIKALIPDSFQLLHHRFAAGNFELLFGARDQKLCLHRWAPARELLGRVDLAEFARVRIGFPGGAPVFTTWNGRPVVEWVVSPAQGPGSRWWARFKASTPYKWLRLWHIERQNRILGIRLESRRPPEPDLLEAVCAAYDVV